MIVDETQEEATLPAGFKVPPGIEFRKALPYSASGKLLRREPRAELASE